MPSPYPILQVAGNENAHHHQIVLQQSTFSGLLACVLLSISPFAVSEDALTSAFGGQYRSSEAPTHDARELGQELSLPTLPDPATEMSKTLDPGIVDLHLPHWYWQDTWITDVGLLLFHDDDRDGYFAGFSLTIDADSSWPQTDVHVTLLLQRPLHATEHLHTSAVFPLYGRSIADEYRIDIELVRHYPVDDYDLVIELYDAWDNALLDRVDARDFSNLRHLPLESEDLDAFPDVLPEPIIDHEPPIPNDDIRVEEHAGSLGAFLVMALALAGFCRRALVCVRTSSNACSRRMSHQCTAHPATGRVAGKEPGRTTGDSTTCIMSTNHQSCGTGRRFHDRQTQSRGPGSG